MGLAVIGEGLGWERERGGVCVCVCGGGGVDTLIMNCISPENKMCS